MAQGRYRVSVYEYGGNKQWFFDDFIHARRKYSSLLFDQISEIDLLHEVVFAELSMDGSEYLPIFRSRVEHPIGLYETGHSKPSWSDCVECIIEEKYDGNVSAAARDIGIDPSNFHAMLSHGRKPNLHRLPSLEMLCKIAETFGYHVGFVPDDAGETMTFHDEKVHQKRGRPRKED